MRFLRTIIFSVVFLLIGSTLFGDAFESRLITVYFELQGKKIPNDVQSEINTRVVEELKKLKGIYIVPDEYLLDENKNKIICTNEKEALDYGKLLTADIVIIGTIGKKVKKSTESLGEGGKNKYLLRIKVEKKYIFNIKVLDVKKKKAILEFKDTLSSKKFKKVAKKFYNELEPFYEPKKIVKKKKEIKKKEKIEREKEEMKPGDGSISLYGTYLQPMGPLGDIVNSGTGIAGNFEINNSFAKNVVFQFGGGHSRMDYNIEYADFYRFYFFDISLGYTLSVFKYLNIIPFAGGGSVFHSMGYNPSYTVDGKSGLSDKIYVDGALFGKLQIDIPVFSHLHLVMMPAYSYFFEKGGSGSYLNYMSGIKIVF